MFQYMKKLFLFLTSIALTMGLCAQSEEQKVTQFLGIPVDGSKSEMISKLKAKGFQSTATNPEVLEGEFNGYDVNIHIGTTNNKVSRIMVADANPISETDIRIRFNSLCEQFNNNPKYASLEEDPRISEDEDISYEMTVNNKRYQAIFYQHQTKLENAADSAALIMQIIPSLLEKYTLQQLYEPTEEIQAEIGMAMVDHLQKLWSKRPVWFMISEEIGGYTINMYYDNEYNRANGEDL